MSQLIFIEGVPGSGKTTTAMWLTEELRQNGMDAKGWWEMDDPHPLHSFWTWDDGYSDPDKIETPYDADVFSQRVVKKCHSIVSHLLSTGETYVIEAYPFQLVVRIHLKMGTPLRHIQDYYFALQDAVSPVHPLLLFFNPPDMEQTFRKICAERGKSFEDFFIGSAVCSPYGRQHNLEGWTGMVHFYTEYDKLVQSLVRQWHFGLRLYQPQVQGWSWVRSDILQGLALPSSAA